MKDDENGMELTPDEKLTALSDLRTAIELEFVRYGELLSEIKQHKYFKIKGYRSFKEFVEVELKISAAFASKLVRFHQLYIIKLGLSDEDLSAIGLDRIQAVDPVVRPLVREDAEEHIPYWLERAASTDVAELREEVKEVREKSKTLSPREVFVSQYIERMTSLLNCSRKELDFKLAIYFQDRDLSEVKREVRTKQSKLELESGEAA